jgi:hypothetical protein
MVEKFFEKTHPARHDLVADCQRNSTPTLPIVEHFRQAWWKMCFRLIGDNKDFTPIIVCTFVGNAAKWKCCCSGKFDS